MKLVGIKLEYVENVIHFISVISLCIPNISKFFCFSYIKKNNVCGCLCI